MKRKLITTLLAGAVIAIGGCGHMSKDFATATKIQKLKNSKSAKPYIAVVKRADKAYHSGNLAMANNLIEIVEKKIATQSPY